MTMTSLGGVHKADCNALFTGCDCGYEQALLDACAKQVERKLMAGGGNTSTKLADMFVGTGHRTADYLAGMADGERRVLGVLAAVVESGGGYAEVTDQMLATHLDLTTQYNGMKMVTVFITRPKGTKP